MASSTENPQVAPDVAGLFSRRHVLGGLGAAGAALLIGGGLAYELGRDDDKPSALSSEIIDGIQIKWQEVSVFAGAVILGETTELSQDPGLDSRFEVEWPTEGKLLGVRRPVMVAETAGLNGFDQDEIDPRIFGFWLPEPEGKKDGLVFARYTSDRAFWPIYRGRHQGYQEDYAGLLGEAVTLSANADGPRHFIVRGPRFDDEESRVRVKDVGQSIATAPGDAARLVLDMSETYGGFELRGWEPREDETVDQGKFENPLDMPDRLAKKITEGLMFEWEDINVFGGVMAVNQATKVYSDARLHEGTEVEWPQDYPHAVVVRPMFVVGSSMLNIEGSELDAVQQSVKRTTVGFFLPGPNKFVFMDTSDNAGSIIPMTRGFYEDQIKTDGLLGYDIRLDGRKVTDNIPYPYFNNEYAKLVTDWHEDADGNYIPAVYETKSRKALVAHSLGFTNGADALANLYDFFADKWDQPLVLND